MIAEYAASASAAAPQKEYGYRNGQLLIAATVTIGWGTAPTFNDNPLQVGVTTVQARHITELRTAIDAVRSHSSLSGYAWQYSATTNDYISANPILEMRTALDQALGAGSYAAGLASGQPVKAVHIQELRDRILGVWQSGSGLDIRWLVSDQLGTPRMIFDQSGSLATTSRHDYLPFGEELFAGTGGRTTAQGYSASDGVRQKFTGHQRDNETGLDYFKARYYSSTQGRFTSADAPFADQRQTDPSSWNSYTYVRNNPCNRTDPNGRCSPPPGLKPGQVGICIEAFIKTKTAVGVLRGDNRTFDGNNEKLTSKFRVDIIAERAARNSKNLNVTEKTTAGYTQVVAGTPGLPLLPPLQGTASSKLNDTRGNSNSPSVSAYDPNGATSITVPIDKGGNANFNISTKAEYAFRDFIDGGSIRSSLNLSVNINNGKVDYLEGSKATGYPSFEIYSYVYQGKEIVTKTVRLLDEGSSSALKEPMKPIP